MNKNNNLPVLYAPYVHIPWGMSAGHIVLKDPYDIRPAADLIATMATKRWADNGLSTHFTLVLGEYHDRPSHKMLEILTLNRLGQMCGNLTAAFECPANLLSENLCEKFPQLKITAKEYYDLIELDHRSKGQVNLLTALQESVDAYAPVTKTLLHINCLENGIRTRLVDAARPYNDGGINSFLRMDDPFVQDFMAELYADTPESFQKIHVSSKLGMCVRNFSMVARSDQFETAGMTVLNVGAAHLMGDTALGYSKEHSLMSFFNYNDIPALPVFLEWDSCPPIEQGEDMIIIEGLSQARFEVGGYDDAKAYQDSFIAEMKEIEKIDVASGRELGFSEEKIVFTLEKNTAEKTAAFECLKLLDALRQKPSLSPHMLING